MPKIYISNHNYGIADQSIKDLLLKKGWSVFFNPAERLLTESEVAKWAKDADALICATEPLKRLVTESKSIKLIAKIGVGLDNIPLKLCYKKGITVTYTPDAVTNAVAELTIANMLSLLRKIHLANQNMRQGRWQRLIGREINEVTIGIIGWGRIGQRVTKLLAPFEPKLVLVNDIVDKQELVNTWQKTGLKIAQSELKKLLTKSDIVTLHADLNTSSFRLLNEKSLRLLKKDALLINTARGDLIDEAALFKTLEQKKIAGGAFDVFQKEPYHKELTKLDSALLTSHMGSFSKSARQKMDAEATATVIDFFEQRPLTSVVPSSEYDKNSFL